MNSASGGNILVLVKAQEAPCSAERTGLLEAALRAVNSSLGRWREEVRHCLVSVGGIPCGEYTDVLLVYPVPEVIVECFLRVGWGAEVQKSN